MKKLLSLLGAFTLSISISVNVISCEQNTAKNNDLNNGQLAASEKLAEATIISQPDNYNLDGNDIINSLKTSNKNFAKNFDSIFQGKNDVVTNFDKDSKVNIQTGSNTIQKVTALFPKINLGNGISSDVVSLINSIPIILGSIGSQISSMVTSIPTQTLQEIFSKEIISTDGTILKNTIGSVDSNNKLVIDNSKYANKTYNEVLTETMNDLGKSVTNIINKVPLTTTDYHNVAYGILIILNYLSQFQFADTITKSTNNNGELLYNVSDDIVTNAQYKGSILTKKFDVLKVDNFSQFFTNMENNDTNAGLGFRQLIFTIFGSAIIDNKDIPFSSQEISTPIKQVLSNMENGWQYNLILILLGYVLGDKISQNLTLNSVISIIAPFIPNDNKDLTKLIKDIKDNPDWYAPGNDSDALGETWTDLWNGTNSHSLFLVIYNAIKSYINIDLPVQTENLKDLYSAIENITMSYKVDGKDEKSLLSIKTLFSLFDNKSKLLSSIFSPSSINLQEIGLHNLNDATNISAAKTSFDSLKTNILNGHLKDGISADDLEKALLPITTIQNNNKDNVLTYIAGEEILYANSDANFVIQDEIDNDIQTIIKSIVPNDKFNIFINDLASALDNAQNNVFNAIVNKGFNETSWAVSKIIKTNDNYSYTLSITNTDIHYQVNLVKDNITNFYKISMNKI